ncbi:MAG TPA: cytochrome c [Acidobacteriota bacterium]
MRNKRIVLFVIFLIQAFLLSVTPLTAGPNPNRGKSIYKNTCKSCHAKAGEAKELTPISKTQDQWKRFFAKSTANTMTKRVQVRTGKQLTAEELSDMQLFLVSHAADSDHPETCGN